DVGASPGRANGQADRAADVPEVQGWRTASAERLWSRRCSDHVQGVGMQQPRMRLQRPYRQRGAELRPNDRHLPQIVFGPLLPVVTSAQSAARDAAAIDAGTPSRALMQRAGAAAAGEIALRLRERLDSGVLLFAGP